MSVLFSLLLVTVLFIIFVLWRYYQYIQRFQRSLKHYPGPPGHPIVGNALDFGKSTDILHQLLNFCKTYGPMYKLSFSLHFFNLICCDPKFLEFMLSSQKILEKSSDYRYLHEWLGTGLLTAGGKKWKQRRRIITPTFHFQILEQFIEVFESAGRILIEKLEKEVDKGETNIYPFITLCALDIICASAMGTSVNAQNDFGSEYVFSVKEMCRILIERSFSLVKMNDVAYRFTKDYQKGKRAVQVLHDYTDSVINRRRKEIENNQSSDGNDEDDSNFGTKKRLAFLDLLLKSTIDGKPLSHEDIREEVDTFMFEGHDTTASGMSFTVHCLANNQEAQKKAVEELKEIFGDDKTRPATYKDLQNMKYLEMVIKESLRLYPSVPMIGRDLDEDIEYDGKILPKGLTLSAFIYGAHHDPNIWPEPEKFDPERFTPENCSRRSPYAYVPFSAGPRNCIGQKFAMLEMKATISKILRNFELHPTMPEHKPILAFETVLKSANGILVRLKKRNF